jgi:DNA-3-methyladenine glycosylase I
MLDYHDQEWGVPVLDDNRQFEFLTLEAAQAGLSWLTILRNRQGYRHAFAGFDPRLVARFTPADVERLLLDASIVRNRKKIESAISNAACFIEVQKTYGSFVSYIWDFIGGRVIDGRRRGVEDVPPVTPLAEKLSRDLKKRGFKFLGPTVIYAHMQAAGLVNDHSLDCFRHQECKELADKLGVA